MLLNRAGGYLSVQCITKELGKEIQKESEPLVSSFSFPARSADDGTHDLAQGEVVGIVDVQSVEKDLVFSYPLVIFAILNDEVSACCSLIFGKGTFV